MAATAAARTTTFVPLSLPKPPPSSQKVSKEVVYSYQRCSSSFSTFSGTQPRMSPMVKCPRSVSSPETADVVDEEEESGPTTPSSSDGDDDDGEMSADSAASISTGCMACGKPETERGCNGEGRIQGGIATVPGFGWWPIKAYRPCPGYVASGGRYRRTGQSMDEVVSGGGGRGAPGGTTNKAKSSKMKGKS